MRIPAPRIRLILSIAVAALVALPVVAAPAALAAPERIAIVRLKYPPSGDAVSSIITMQPSGKKQKTVRKKTFDPSASLPLFAAAELSPDGKHLLFGVGRADAKGTIWTSKAGGKQAKRIVKLAGNKSVGSPSWSPDGKKIVYVQLNHDSGASSLVVAKADGKGRKKIHTVPSGLHVHPTWSPDGKRILFTFRTGDFSSPRRVASVKAGGGGRKWLTDAGAWCLSGNWSPDGKRITYTCRLFARRGFPTISLFTAKANGTGIKVIAGGEIAGGHPAYTPDGKRVMLMRQIGGDSYDLYSKSIKGTGGWKRLTETGDHIYSTFDISPAGFGF